MLHEWLNLLEKNSENLAPLLRLAAVAVNGPGARLPAGEVPPAL
jgi:hypothetical protein